VTRIYNYFKRFGYKTEVMGASFRNLGEITELAGCDLLTIAPNFLDELSKTTGDLPRKLAPEKAQTLQLDRIAMDEGAFRKAHAADKMASDKLEEGIAGFTKSIVTLEKLLGDRL
jgi:transaldolase